MAKRYYLDLPSFAEERDDPSSTGRVLEVDDGDGDEEDTDQEAD